MVDSRTWFLEAKEQAVFEATLGEMGSIKEVWEQMSESLLHTNAPV